MDPRTNPYTPNAGAVPPALVGLDNQLESFGLLLDQLRAGYTEQSMIITGLRGVGKTVLLNQFRDQVESAGWVSIEIEASKHDDSAFRRELALHFRRALLEIAQRERWKDRMHRAVIDNAAWLDPVQRELVTDLVNNGVVMLGASGVEVRFDPDDDVVLVDLPELNVELASYFRVVVTDPNDPERLERFKIKTGKQGTSSAEAVILLSDTESSARFTDLMLRDGAIEPIELTPVEREAELKRLYELADKEPDLRDRRPGRQCYVCDRVARCGQYPSPAGYRVGTRQRTIRVSKSDVLRLDECHRRLAWKALHIIPKDTEDETSAAAASGLLFHEMIAIVLLADDHDAAFARELERVSPDESETLTALYDRHQQIESEHFSVAYRRTEYQVGSTFILEGLDADRDGNVRDGVLVAVTVIARTDAVGREPDGTPAVIEYRTGKTSDLIDERETALYAISTARLFGVNDVAVHQHSLRGGGEPKCIRIGSMTGTALNRRRSSLRRCSRRWWDGTHSMRWKPSTRLASGARPARISLDASVSVADVAYPSRSGKRRAVSFQGWSTITPNPVHHEGARILARKQPSWGL